MYAYRTSSSGPCSNDSKNPDQRCAIAAGSVYAGETLMVGPAPLLRETRQSARANRRRPARSSVLVVTVGTKSDGCGTGDTAAAREEPSARATAAAVALAAMRDVFRIAPLPRPTRRRRRTGSS